MFFECFLDCKFTLIAETSLSGLKSILPDIIILPQVRVFDVHRLDITVFINPPVEMGMVVDYMT